LAERLKLLVFYASTHKIGRVRWVWGQSRRCAESQGRVSVFGRPRLGAWRLSLVAAGTLLIAAHTAWWVITQRQLHAGLKTWIAERRAAGWTVNAHKPQSTGWPLAAGLSFRDCAIAGGQAEIPNGFRWSAARVSLYVPLRQPHTLVVRPEGGERLRIGNGPELAYNAWRLTATMPLEAEASPREADIRGTNVRIGIVAEGAAEGRAATIALMRVRIGWDPMAGVRSPAVAVEGSAEAIALPAHVRWPLGSHISSVTLAAFLDGPVPAGTDPASRAQAWRDAGGMVEMKNLALGWGPLGLTANARLTLDDRLQPVGWGTVRVVDYAPTLDRLAANGSISPQAAGAAKAVLGLFAEQGESGGGTVELPLRLEDERLSVGQIPLARVPLLDWLRG
jgi:hypothetical protein